MVEPMQQSCFSGLQACGENPYSSLRFDLEARLIEETPENLYQYCFRFPGYIAWPTHILLSNASKIKSMEENVFESGPQ